MLTWSYLDPEREREQWLYLPSMRKARRSSPAEDDENTLGTVLTVEEITSWRPEHEKYRLLGAQNFNGYISFLINSSITGVSHVTLSRQCPKEKMPYDQKEPSGCAAMMAAAFSRKFMTKTASCSRPFSDDLMKSERIGIRQLCLLKPKTCAPVKKQ